MAVKRKTAKEILAESFRELAETKKIDRITISEIAENCGYSPATFYRQFKDKYDLIAWDYAQRIEKVVLQIEEGGNRWRRALRAVLDYYQVEREYLTNLLIHTGGHDSFIQYMVEINEDVLTAYIRAVSGTAASDRKTALLIRMYCMGTVSLSCEWILGRFSMSAAELTDIFEESLPGLLRPLVLSDE